MISIRIMSEKSFKKALLKARNEGHQEGREAALRMLELEKLAAQEGWAKYHKAVELLEARSKDRIIEVIKDSLTELINDSAGDLANELEYEAEEQIDETKKRAVLETKA